MLMIWMRHATSGRTRRTRPLPGNGRVGETLIGVAPGTRRKGRKGGKSGVSSPLAAEEFDDGRAGGRVANTKKWNEMDDYL